MSDLSFLEEDLQQSQASLLLALKRVNELELQLQHSNSNTEAQLAHEKQRANDAEEELTALKQQLIALRDLYNKSLEQNEKKSAQIPQTIKETRQIQLEALYSKERETNQNLKDEIETLNHTLSESQQHSKQLERVIQFLRERAEESHLEAKQLREEFQANREQLDALSAQDEAKNDELRMSQQHLGKKIKEASQLAEKNEELSNQVQNLQRELSQAQSNEAEFQQTLTHHNQREKQLQEQLENHTQSFNNQLKKWEEKYQQVYENWQEAEGHVRSLRVLEEKHHQAQNALANILTIFGPQTARPVPAPSAKHPSPPALDDHRSTGITFTETVHTPASAKPEKASLFENAAQPIRYKQTLFD